MYVCMFVYIYRSRELGETRDTRLEVEALPGKAEGMAFEFDRVFGPLSSQAFIFLIFFLLSLTVCLVGPQSSQALVFCKKQNWYCNVDFHWNVYVCNVYMYVCMDGWICL